LERREERPRGIRRGGALVVVGRFSLHTGAKSIERGLGVLASLSLTPPSMGRQAALSYSLRDSWLCALVPQAAPQPAETHTRERKIPFRICPRRRR
jgi:hypothetical protein